jgi:trigger factor
MNITTKAIDASTLTAHIELDASELDHYVQEARKQIAQEVTIEGFRKGKAPQHLVDKQLNTDVVRTEALELALEGSFSEAVVKEGWDIIRTTDLKIEKNDSTGLQYGVQVHVWPAVTLPDLSAVHVPRKAIEVAEPEIDEALDTVRNMRATFLDKVEAAVTGDRVEVDFDASIAGTPIEGGSSRNHPLVIGGKSFMPGFEDALIGLVPGESKQFTLTAPDDYYEPTVAGKRVDFSVTMRRVQSVLKPAADDAFAKSLGGFGGLEALRVSLREGIANEKRAKEKQRVRLAILDAIIEQSSVPAPESLVKSELDDMVHRFGHDLQGRGIELSMYLARMKKTEDDLRKDWHAEAQRQVRITLVLRTTARQKSITVTPEEVDAALNDTIAELIKQGQVTEDQVDPQRIRGALQERMLTDRTLEFLEGTCATE